MSKRLCTAIFCLAWLLGEPHHANAASGKPDRLHFEHIGEQDGAGPPFDIAIDAGEQSTYVLVLVSPPAYAALRELVARAPKSANSQAAGTFEVTEYVHGQPRRSVIVLPAAMREVVALVRHDSALHKAPLPAAIAIQEQLLKLK